MATHLSNMFSLLSVGFAAPTMARAQLMVDGTFACEVVGTWEALGLPASDAEAFSAEMAAYKGREAEEVLHEIRREYTRLFMLDRVVEITEGPFRKRSAGHKAVLYMVNDISMGVQDFMRTCGVVRPAGYNDSVDMIDNEWYFCSILADDPAYLAEHGLSAEDKLQEFVEDHVRLWVPDFSDHVIAETRVPYYRALAALQKKLVEAL